MRTGNYDIPELDRLKSILAGVCVNDVDQLEILQYRPFAGLIRVNYILLKFLKYIRENGNKLSHYKRAISHYNSPLIFFSDSYLN